MPGAGLKRLREWQEQAFWEGRHKFAYIRQFPNITDKRTGRPLEYKIDRNIALYILDGHDKAERLAASSRDNPCVSYTGQSRVWREQR